MEFGNVLMYAGYTLGSLIIYYMITQWVHQIQRRNRYLKAQIELLAKIAEKQGVAKDDIESILHASGKAEKPLGLK